MNRHVAMAVLLFVLFPIPASHRMWRIGVSLIEEHVHVDMAVLLGVVFPVSAPVRLVSRPRWFVIDSSVAVWFRSGVLPLQPFPSRRPPAVTRRSHPSRLSIMH